MFAAALAALALPPVAPAAPETGKRVSEQPANAQS
jgi:hypothetical protein